MRLAENVGMLADGVWTASIAAFRDCLRGFRIEVLARETRLQPAPDDIEIPSVFDGPYYIFDTLFHCAA
jgi:hypothetical protein